MIKGQYFKKSESSSETRKEWSLRSQVEEEMGKTNVENTVFTMTGLCRRTTNQFYDFLSFYDVFRYEQMV